MPRFSASLFSPFCQGGKTSRWYRGGSDRPFTSSLAAESVGSSIAIAIRLRANHAAEWLFGILKSGSLELRKRPDCAWRQDNAGQKMIGHFGCELLVRQLVGVDVSS